MKWVKQIEEAFVGVSLLIVTLILFVNIVLRYGFSANTNWAEELIRYMMIWITFIGSSICFRRSMHVGIHFIIDIISKKSGILVSLFVNLLSIIFMLFIFYYGVELVLFSISTGQITPSLQIQIFLVYLALPIGSALSLIHLSTSFVQRFKQFKALEEQ